jgi:hypothetical protein
MNKNIRNLLLDNLVLVVCKSYVASTKIHSWVAEQRRLKSLENER